MHTRSNGSTRRLIVDLGCGPGSTTSGLAEAFPDATIIGLDIDEAMITYSRETQTYARCEFYAQDIGASWDKGWPEELKQLLHGKADIVYSNLTLHWVDDFDSLASNIY